MVTTQALIVGIYHMNKGRGKRGGVCLNKYWPEEWKKKLPNFLGEGFFQNFESFENWENVEFETEKTGAAANKATKKVDVNNSSSIRINIYESGHELLCIARLPGLEIKNVDIDVYDSTLEISGTVRVKNNGFRAIQEEIYQGPVRRRVSLPYPVRQDKISASYKHGHLMILLHRHLRSEDSKPKIIIDDLDID